MIRIKNRFDLRAVIVHIPRTGGTSILDTFRKDPKLKFIHDADNYSNLNMRYSKRYPKGLLNGYVVMGHFRVDKYDQFNCIKATILRKPEIRVLSTYNTLWKKNLNERSDPEHFKLLKEKLTLVDFAELPRLRNQMTKYCSGDLDKFDFVGLTEYHKESFLTIRRLVGGSIDLIDWINQSKHTYPATRIELEKVLELNKEDSKLYKEASKRFIRKGGFK